MKITNLISTVLLFAFTAVSAFGQYDTEAKEILDKLTERTKGFSSLKVKFNYIIQDQKSKEKENYTGTLYTKGEKYKLFFMKTEIFFNGKDLTSFAVEQKEATISTPDNDSEEINNPAKLLTIHESGFKFRYAGEVTIDAVETQLIELVPENREGKKYSKVKLWINKAENKIHMIKVIGKNGVNYQIEITEYKPNIKVTDQLFEFNEEAHPDVEVIDIREE